MLRNVICLAIGLVVGGGAILCFRCEKAPVGLVDGKYLVLDGPSGHWIYEAGGAGGGLKLVSKEVSPEGLHGLWELQSAYQPKAMLSGSEEIIYLPYTQYSTQTGSFQVVHKFYKVKDGKLVEVQMETAQDAK